MAAFEWKKLSTSDRVVVVAGAVALVALFLPWYGYSALGFSASVGGFGSGYGWLGALLVVAAGVYLAMQRSGSQMPQTSYGPGVIVLGASGLGALLVILRWATLPRGSGGVDGVGTFSYGPRIGIYVALIAALVQAVVSFQLFKKSGESAPWQK